MEKCLIAAISDDYALGKDNDLLWHLSEDLKYFKRLTSGHPVIMGRKTYESIGRPLPGRLNIVLTRKAQTPGGDGVAPVLAETSPVSAGPVPTARTSRLLYASTLEEAFALAASTPFEGRVDEPDQCFVMGGGSLYKQALPLCDKLYLTEVHTTRPDADTFFPAFDKKIYREFSRSELYSENNLTYHFVIYGR